MSNNMSHDMEGYLELIIGPMWSGKTSKLLELYKQFTFCEINTLVINYAHDTRYSQTKLSTHDRREIPCVQAIRLTEVADIIPAESKTTFSDVFTSCEIILINEGQFFKDIVEWVKCAVEKQHKKVYVCGLDGDFKREVFGNWLDLIPFCDEVTKLRSYCGSCKKRPALFTHRKTDAQEQELIGTDEYLPVCRKCYLEKITE
jgi:thymidine kinase